MNTIKAKKIEMTQVFAADGCVVPVTRLEIEYGAEALHSGDIVDVSGTSKGKGFAGGVKRYSFAGGPKTRGQSDRHRAPGSIGAGTDPGRVWKGQRMAGRMGNSRVTVKNLEIVEVGERHALVKGGIPGSRNSIVELVVVNVVTSDSQGDSNS
jgi:50S ribosomal protein uL3